VSSYLLIFVFFRWHRRTRGLIVLWPRISIRFFLFFLDGSRSPPEWLVFCDLPLPPGAMNASPLFCRAASQTRRSLSTGSFSFFVPDRLCAAKGGFVWDALGGVVPYGQDGCGGNFRLSKTGLSYGPPLFRAVPPGVPLPMNSPPLHETTHALIPRAPEALGVQLGMVHRGVAVSRLSFTPHPPPSSLAFLFRTTACWPDRTRGLPSWALLLVGLSHRDTGTL